MLSTWNLHVLAAGAHFATALVIGITAVGRGNYYTLPVTWTRLSGAPGSSMPEKPEVIFEVWVWLVLVFFSLAAVADHLYVTYDWKEGYDSAEMFKWRSRWRYREYSVSATLMLLVILMLCGVSDFGALLTSASSSGGAMLLGSLMEEVNPSTGGRAPAQVNWSPFRISSVLATVPWVVAFVSAARSGPPAFVYGILASLLFAFSLFALVQFIYFYYDKEEGRDERMERRFVYLSLFAKQLLNWQIYANVLVMS